MNTPLLPNIFCRDNGFLVACRRRDIYYCLTTEPMVVSAVLDERVEERIILYQAKAFYFSDFFSYSSNACSGKCLTVCPVRHTLNMAT